MQQLADIALVPAFAGQALPVVGIAGRIDSGPAAQGLHHQTRIVGHADQAGDPGHGAGLDQGVFLKGRAGLLNVLNLGEGLQPDDFHAEIGQGPGQFAHLARVMGRQDDALFFFRHMSAPLERVTLACDDEE